MINEKTAVKTGMKFVKTFAFVTPICRMENAKRIKAPQEAKKASAATGRNDFNVNCTSVNALRSKIRKTGRNKMAPIIF
jgi:hypothetical protein